METKADRLDLPPDPKALERVTLRELIERYRDNVTIRKRRAETEKIVLNAFLRDPICDHPISRLTTVHFAEYRDQRLKTVKPSTLRRELGTIGHLFTVARIEWGLPIKRSPLADLRIEGTQDRRERRLRPGEWERLMEAAKSRRNPHVIPIIILAVETGMRRGEILAMKWEHFDQGTRSLLIPETKNGHARIIPLSSSAMSLLLELSREGDRIFPMAPNAFRLSWQRVRDRAGLHGLHFHDLRHEAVSRFFERGLTIPEVALVSGHRDARMLFRYAHPMREAIAAKIG
jgi:integrase